MRFLRQDVADHSKCYKTCFNDNLWSCLSQKWIIFHRPKTLRSEILSSIFAFDLSQSPVNCITAECSGTHGASVNIITNVLK